MFEDYQYLGMNIAITLFEKTIRPENIFIGEEKNIYEQRKSHCNN